MNKVIIFGIGEMSEIAHFYLSQDKNYEVIAFSLDKDFISENKFKNLPVVPFEFLEDSYSPFDYQLFVSIGYNKINKLREQKFSQAKEKGYSCISYVHPNASVASNAVIGENCFIFEDNTIQPFVTIEDNCILWSGNHIGHHSTIGKNCFITSQVVISGGCEVGKNTFIGVNATLRDHISIGESNVIGAGALILSDTKDNEVYMQRATEASRVPSNKLRGI